MVGDCSLSLYFKAFFLLFFFLLARLQSDRDTGSRGGGRENEVHCEQRLGGFTSAFSCAIPEVITVVSRERAC